MNDNDIKKALEICIDFVSGGESMCKNCPLYDCNNCSEEQRKQALDLINRLEAENERLDKRIAGQKHALFEQQSYTAELQNELKTAKSEAIKEFAERFEKKIKDVKFTMGQTWEIKCALKQTLQEMTEQ